MIDIEWLQRVMELMAEADVDSVEISRFGTRVKIAKSPPVHLVTGNAAGGNPPPATSAGAAAPVGKETPEAAPAEAEAGPDLHEIRSPMVGTFYRAPAPDAPPYVEVGDLVRKGDTLCILEAMKLMNELESEVAGTVREICVQNADPVEYGEVLFRIDTSEA